MAELHFSVRSASSGEIYELRAYPTDTGLRFSCSCPAGEHGIYCRHRLSLISGDITNLASDNAQDVELLKAMVEKTAIPAVLARISELEAVAAQVKRDIGGAKKKLAILFMG